MTDADAAGANPSPAPSAQPKARERGILGKPRPAGFAALVVIAAILAIAAAARAATIDSVRLQREGAVTELHFAVKGSAPRLKLKAHGNELWVDLEQTHLDLPPRPLYRRESGAVASVRAVDRGGMRSRLVVQVNGRADYAIAQMPDEIVLRLAPAGQVANLAAPLLARAHANRPSYPAQPMQTPAPIVTPFAPPAEPGTPSLAQASPAPSPGGENPRSAPEQISTNDAVIQRPPSPELSSAVVNPLSGNPLVMIDPGHGGYDPGTQSLAGAAEKDLALEISTRVVAALKNRGVRAQMTRGSDYFVPLPERTRRANIADAELFVSIHLNSSPNSDTSGIEVYYLNNTTDRATIRLARMENAGITGASGARTDSNLNYILADLRQNYKANESASLARMIDAQTVADLDSQLGLNVNPLGARKGPFYVLVGAHMPAVLVECGFLSNGFEAARLSSAQYQDVLAQGIAGAIVHYLSADAAVGNL